MPSLAQDWTLNESGILVSRRDGAIVHPSPPVLPLHDVALIEAWDAVERKVHEVGGNNRGKDVEAYQKEAGTTPGEPWCAAAVFSWVDRASHLLEVPCPLLPVPNHAYVQSYYDYGRAHGAIVPAAEAVPGDLYLLFFPSLHRYGHIGMLDHLGPGAGTLHGIEGNTNEGGSRDGEGVFPKTRPVTSHVAFFHY